MVHSEAQLEKALRHRVVDCFRRDDTEELTVRRVRQFAEQSLDLEEGFFKNGDWKDKSKRIIEDEVVYDLCSSRDHALIQE